MSESKHDELLRHMKFHHVKQWLLDGCKAEGAHTIGDAVGKIPERRLIRRLARALSKDS
jgi:hypothetical protein